MSKSLEGRIESWNKSAELMFGYSGDDIIDQHISRILPPDRRMEESILIEQVKAGIRIQQFESVRIHKDGHPIHVSLTVSPIMNANGQVSAVSTIARDITERKACRAHLDSTAPAHRIVPTTRFFSWDMERGILDWNRGCEQFYTATPARRRLGETAIPFSKAHPPVPLKRFTSN
jgi:PAS domain S-box-containing protein